MRILAVILLALAVTGCATLNKLVGSTTNPVTKEMLYAAENSTVVVFAGLNAYKRACAARQISQSCRGVVANVQVYTRRLPPVLARLRSFVRDNDTINAVVVFNELNLLLASVKSVAVSSGVRVQ